MNSRFRVSGRRAGLVASAPPEVVEEVEAEVIEPTAVVEPPASRMRLLRRDFAPTRPPTQASREPMAERLLETLSTALTALAAKPAQPVALHVAPSTVELVMPESLSIPAPIVNVAVPEQQIDVHVPAAHAPQIDVHVPAAATPQIDVHVPEQPPAQVVVAAAEAPDIIVNVPEQPAPIVNVTNENHVEVDVPRPRPVRVEKLAGGAVRYVPEDV